MGLISIFFSNDTTAAAGTCNCGMYSLIYCTLSLRWRALCHVLHSLYFPVSAEESECQYWEFKTYGSSSCSGDYETGAVVVRECFSGGESKSYKFDCETDTFLIAEYSNSDTCGGGTDWEDHTGFRSNCIQYTCKSDANVPGYGASIFLFAIGLLRLL